MTDYMALLVAITALEKAVRESTEIEGHYRAIAERHAGTEMGAAFAGLAATYPRERERLSMARERLAVIAARTR